MLRNCKSTIKKCPHKLWSAIIQKVNKNGLIFSLQFDISLIQLKAKSINTKDSKILYIETSHKDNFFLSLYPKMLHLYIYICSYLYVFIVFIHRLCTIKHDDSFPQVPAAWLESPSHPNFQSPSIVCCHGYIHYRCHYIRNIHFCLCLYIQSVDW